VSILDALLNVIGGEINIFGGDVLTKRNHSCPTG